MKKAKIFQRTLALTLAAVMLAAVASCRHKIGDSAVSESDTASDLQSAEEKYYYPVTKELCFDEDGELSCYYEYEYSSEGYLLNKRIYNVPDGKLNCSDSTQYSYDENGRMVKEVNDYSVWDNESKQWNYDRWTTTYEYDDRGRKIAYENVSETFHMKERTEVIDESALVKTDSFVRRSTLAYCDDKLTGGYLSRLSSSQDNVDGGQMHYWKDELYDANGKLLWSRSHYDDGQAMYDEYQYDDKGRVISQSTRCVIGSRVDEILYSVEYDDRSRVIARQRKIDNPESWVFFYNEDGTYAGCDETDAFGYVQQERCEYDADGKLIRMTFHDECENGVLHLRDRKKEFSDYDANGNCGTVTFYALTDDGDWELNTKHTYEYGDKIPKGVKYGISQDQQEEQRLAVLYFDNDERMFHEFLNR